jgi:N6-adenosine-specific RNA methylase IME4
VYRVSKLAQRVTKAIAQTSDAMTVGAFRFSAKGLADVSGTPKFADWEDALGKLRRIESGVQFWIGDLLNYGEHAYGEKYAQAVDETQADVWRNYSYVSANVNLSLRSDSISWSHHLLVAKFSDDPERQKRLLTEARDKALSVSDFKALIRGQAHAAKVAAIEAGELPQGEYDVVCADPPWQYDNSGFDQSAANHYPTQDTETICRLPHTADTFPRFADPSVLFLWATSPLLPAAHAVMDAWGYEYKACMVWVKDRAPGLGWWLHTRHELILIGVRGTSTPQEKIDSVIQATAGEHSRKPDEAYAAIERMFPGMRRVEIFARGPRVGWDVWGNEA